MIAAGLGFRRSATFASLFDAYEKASGLALPDCLATASDKAETSAFQALAQATSLPIAQITNASIQAQSTATQSEASSAARQTGSVAEAAALAAAGPGARLLGPRVVSDDRLATCALAERTAR
ncbi:MAG: cobalamin biosynthesis protein [Pseudomonadota bacterium]